MISFIKHFDDDQGMVGRACIRFRSLAVGSLLDPSPAAVYRYGAAAVACGANKFEENSQPVYIVHILYTLFIWYQVSSHYQKVC